MKQPTIKDLTERSTNFVRHWLKRSHRPQGTLEKQKLSVPRRVWRTAGGRTHGILRDFWLNYDTAVFLENY